MEIGAIFGVCKVHELKEIQIWILFLSSKLFGSVMLANFRVFPLKRI